MIDTSQLAIPKPGHVGETAVVKLTPHQYRGQKRKVWDRQGQGCAHCMKGISINEMELHHESREGFAGKTSHGRGLGGGKRNDLKTIGLCHACHVKAEEEKR